MNKRIRELAEEHGLIHDHMSVGERNDALKKFEKIAMLIVNECYNRAEGQWHHSSDEWDKGVVAVMNSIEELFGVEE
jgi:hypothetical protein